MGPLCYIHGDWVPASEAKVSLFDSGLMYGETITETLRTFRRQPYEAERHLARFADSCGVARITVDPAIDLAALLGELATRNSGAFEPEDELLLKLDVTRGIFGYYREPGVSYDDFTLLLHPIRLPFHRFAAAYESGMSVVYPYVRQQSSQTLDARVKHRSRLYQAIAEREAADMEVGAAPLLLDLDGCLAEGTGWNLFVVRDGILRTPTTESALAGISRAVVFDIARELGLVVREETLRPYDLATADEAFATATSYCLLPITRAHGRPVADGRPGPISKRLLRAWSDRVGMDIAGQARQRAAVATPARAVSVSG
jgi:branched-chain amino acid aminotransferase